MCLCAIDVSRVHSDCRQTPSRQGNIGEVSFPAITVLSCLHPAHQSFWLGFNVGPAVDFQWSFPAVLCVEETVVKSWSSVCVNLGLLGGPPSEVAHFQHTVGERCPIPACERCVQRSPFPSLWGRLHHESMGSSAHPRTPRMDDPRRANQPPTQLYCFLVGAQFCVCQEKDEKTEAMDAVTRAATGSVLFVSIGDQI